MAQAIRVTEEMIAAGCRFTDDLCPVARALGEAGFDAVSVSAGGFTYLADDGGLRGLRHVEISSAVSDKIVRFDDLGSMNPFEMVIEGGMLFLATEVRSEAAA